MRSLLKWFWLLNKRLYKKTTFLVIMALIPLCVVALSFAAQQQSGFLTIVLAQEDPADAVASQLVDTLLQEKSLIQFSLSDDPDTALDAVNTGAADCAWIFRADMQQRLEAFVASKSRHDAAVRIVERETTVFSRISQEKLTALLYTFCAKPEYLRYIRSSVDALASVPDGKLLDTYDAIAISEELFTFENVEGTVTGSAQANYLTAPIRGLMSILVCLCAAAATAYYMQDEQIGTFSLVKEHLRPLVAFSCIMIAALNIAAMAFLALAATGLLAGVWRELIAMLLYCTCCTGFWLLLKELLPDAKWLCALLPILVLAMVALCPVFFHFAALTPVSHLFAPTYYIRSAHDSRYLLYMAGYTAVTLSCAGLLHWRKPRTG